MYELANSIFSLGKFKEKILSTESGREAWWWFNSQQEEMNRPWFPQDRLFGVTSVDMRTRACLLLNRALFLVSYFVA